MVGPGELDHVGGQLHALVALDLPEDVGGAQLVLRGLREHVTHRVALVAAHERVDRAVERGREQQGLAGFGRHVEQVLDRGQEAHVGHAVGLVDDDDLDLAEVDFTALDEIGETARARDDDVDAATQVLQLQAEPGTAVEGRDPQLARAAEPLELAADLGRELAGGYQHEPARTAGIGTAEASGQRDAERDRLARAGGGAPAEITAGDAVGDGEGLDGERLVDAARGEWK